MTAQDFREAVAELRRSQRYFFRTEKGSEERERAKHRMREQEAVVQEAVDKGLARWPKDTVPTKDSERFFFAVYWMMKAQREWMQSPGYWTMEQSRAKEKEVDGWLAKFDEEVREEKLRRHEAERQKQTSLFA